MIWDFKHIRIDLIQIYNY